MKNFFGLITIVALAFSFVLTPAPNRDGGILEVGDAAPDFSLKGVDGKTFTLSDYKGQFHGAIITFTCNTCPYSKMYEDRLIALHRRYADTYPVIAINPNDPSIKAGDSFQEMQTRARAKGFHFPYLVDQGQKVFPKYGATRTPHVFLLDRDMVVRYIGAIDDNAQDAQGVKKKYLENAIQALMKGQEPNPSFTKAIGCSIKAKVGLATN